MAYTPSLVNFKVGLTVMQLVAIALGGAVGALLRYWVSTAAYTALGRDFPWGTLLVNTIGSLAIGFLTVLFLEKLALSGEWRAAILIGVLGAFTTFSTFSIETLQLLEAGRLLRAFLNVLLSVILCLFACWIGVISARSIF